MNIISSNCLGGHLYRDLLHCEYGNPFIWSRIHNEDFIYLISNFSKINFYNYEILKQAPELKKFKIRIDDKFEVNYNHHIFSPKHSTPTKIGIDVYYNKIWEYITEKYEKRLAIMEDRIDLVAVDDFGGYDIERIYNICKSNRIRCFMCTDKLEEEYSDYILVRKRFSVGSHGPGPGDIHLKYGNEIKEFLGIR